MKYFYLFLLFSFSISAWGNDQADLDRLTDEAIQMAGSGLSPKEREILKEKLAPHREKIHSLMKMSTEEQMKFVAEGQSYLKSEKGEEELRKELERMPAEERELYLKLR